MDRTVCCSTSAPERSSSQASNSKRRIECCTQGTFTCSPLQWACSFAKVRNLCGYSAGSISSSRTTSGVIQPAQSFRRGKRSLSSTSTSAPARFSFHAAVDPAGPPPTITTSRVFTLEALSSACASSGVQVRARGRDVVVLPRSENDLEELQRARSECGDRAGQVEPPHAHELLVEHAAHPLRARLEELEPVSERARIVQPQVLHIEDGKIQRLEQIHHLAERGWLGTGEDAPLDPGVQPRRTIASDRVNETATVRADRALCDLAERRIILHTDMLEHPDRDEGVVVPGDVPVIVLDVLDPIGEPLGRGALAREAHLLVRDVERAHFHPVVPRHMQGERAPPEPRLDDRLTRLQAELAADVVHLGSLRLIERRRLLWVIRTRISHRASEPERIELVADVVMVVNVVARACEGVAARPMQGAGEPAQQRSALFGACGSSIDRLEQTDEIAVDVDAALAIEIPEGEMRIAQQREEHAAILQSHGRNGIPATGRDALPVREHERNRRIPEGLEQPADQPALGRASAWLARPEALLRRAHCAPARARAGAILIAIVPLLELPRGRPAWRMTGPESPLARCAEAVIFPFRLPGCNSGPRRGVPSKDRCKQTVYDEARRAAPRFIAVRAIRGCEPRRPVRSSGRAPAQSAAARDLAA